MPRKRISPSPVQSMLQGGDPMKQFPSISSIKRVFFSPVDEKRIERTRDRVQSDMNRLNIMNIR